MSSVSDGGIGCVGLVVFLYTMSTRKGLFMTSSFSGGILTLPPPPCHHSSLFGYPLPPVMCA